jgi:thiol-disulfide isomerase/thioredoxin
MVPLSKVFRILAGLSVLLILAVPAAGGNAVGQAADNFTLPLVEGGKTVKLSDFRGKPAVVVFWATWCPPCRREIPDLKELHKQYGPKGVALLAVAVDFRESREDVARFRKDYDLPYTVLWDADNTVSSAYAVEGIPTILLVDPEGVIRYRAHALDETFLALLKNYLPKS